MREYKILVVDDEKSIRKTVAFALEEEGYSVASAENGKETMKKLEGTEFDLILLDLRLPDINGMEILQDVKRRGLDSTIIVITAHGTIDSAVEAVKSGAYHYITKPINMDNMKHVLKEALEKKALVKENSMLRETLESRGKFSGLVFQSKKMKDVVELVKLAAKSDNNVLIIGETGTGKELISEAIHLNSKRSNNNYMRINCAALPETILESELFGHEKGAFTDAKVMKKGIFELSDRGSILFDEIGCMTASTQSKILRVIENQEVRRLGGERTFKVDVRVIAATNEDLEQAIQKGFFRADLYYRLNVVKIEVPPLRDRKEDITALVKHFVNKHCRIEKRDTITISPDAMEILLEHDWPGNIRELENVIQRAFIYDIGTQIGVEQLPHEIMKRKTMISLQIPNSGVTYKDFTIELVRQTLEKTQGNKKHAADILGVSREFIRRHLPKDYSEQ